jgi:hypothetical protein
MVNLTAIFFNGETFPGIPTCHRGHERFAVLRICMTGKTEMY